MATEQPEINTTTPSTAPTTRTNPKKPIISEWLAEHTKLMFLQTLLDNLSTRDKIDRAVVENQVLVAVGDSKGKIAYSLSEVEAMINSQELATIVNSVLIQSQSSQLKFKMNAGEINDVFKNKDRPFMLQTALRDSDCPFNLGDELTFKQKIVFLAALLSAQNTSLQSTFQKLNLPQETDKKIENGLIKVITDVHTQSLADVFAVLKLHTQNLHTHAHPTLFQVEFNFQPNLPLTTARWDKISPTFHNALAEEIDKQALKCAIVQRKIEILTKLQALEQTEVQKVAQQRDQIKKILKEFYNNDDPDPSCLQLQRILTSLNELESSLSQSTESLPSLTSLPQLAQNNKKIEEIADLTTVIVEVDEKSSPKIKQRKWTAGTLFRIEMARLLGLTDEFYQQMKFELHCKTKAAIQSPQNSQEILSFFMSKRYGDGGSKISKNMEQIFSATDEIILLVKEVASSSFLATHLLLKNNYKNLLKGYETRGARGYEMPFVACSLALHIMSKNPSLQVQVSAFMQSMEVSGDTLLQEIATEIREVQENYKLQFTPEEAKEIKSKNKGKKQVQFDLTEETSPHESPVAYLANQIEKAILTINEKTWSQWVGQVWWGSYYKDLEDLLKEDRLAPAAILMLYKQEKFQILDLILSFLNSVKETWAEEILNDYQQILEKLQARKNLKPPFDELLNEYSYVQGEFTSPEANEKEAEILEIMSIAYSIWEPKSNKDLTFDKMIDRLKDLPANTTLQKLEQIERNWKGQNPNSYKEIPHYIKACAIYEQNKKASIPSESKVRDADPALTPNPDENTTNIKQDSLPNTSVLITPVTVPSLNNIDPVLNTSITPTAIPLPETKTPSQSNDVNPEAKITPQAPSDPPVLPVTSDAAPKENTAAPIPPDSTSAPILIPLPESQQNDPNLEANVWTQPQINSSTSPVTPTTVTKVENIDPTLTSTQVVTPPRTSTQLNDQDSKTTRLTDEKKYASIIIETPALRHQFIRLLENKIRITHHTQPSQHLCWEFLLTTLSDPSIPLDRAIRGFQWRLNPAQRNYNLQQGQCTQKMGVGLLALSVGLESWAFLTSFVLSEYSRVAIHLSPAAMTIGIIAIFVGIRILSQAKESREIGRAFADETAISLETEVQNLLELAQNFVQHKTASARDTLLPHPLVRDRKNSSSSLERSQNDSSLNLT